MGTRSTEGYAERLMAALHRGPDPTSKRGLHVAMTERYPGLRGTSYGGIRKYAEGGVRNPRLELLRAIAEVKDVRYEWLAFGSGAMTEDEERVRAEQRASAPPAEGIANPVGWGWRDFVDVVQQEFTPDSGRLGDNTVAYMAILGAWGSIIKRGPPLRWRAERQPEQEPPMQAIGAILGGRPYIPVPAEITEGDRLAYAMAVAIGRALAAPFRYFPVGPDDLSDDEFEDYVTSICQSLRRIAGTPWEDDHEREEE